MANRANAAFAEDSVPSYYRINAFFPFVDHSRVQNISAEHVEDIHTSYEDDLPDSIGFIAEIER